MVVRHTTIKGKSIKGVLMAESKGEYIGTSDSGKYDIWKDDIYILKERNKNDKKSN